MVLTDTQRALGRISGGLGILQGTAWFSMSLACIILYNRDPLLLHLEPSDGYMSLWNLEVYAQYLLDNRTNSDAIVTPSGFTAFMWLYLVLNALLFLVSAFQILSIYGKALKLANVFKAWSIITCAIALLDFILVVLLGADFDKCKSYNEFSQSQEGACIQVIIPVLIIAAKGFVLWFVNVIFAIVIYKISNNILVKASMQDRILTLDRQIPRATLPQAPSQGSPYRNYPEDPRARNYPEDYRLGFNNSSNNNQMWDPQQQFSPNNSGNRYNGNNPPNFRY